MTVSSHLFKTVAGAKSREPQGLPISTSEQKAEKLTGFEGPKEIGNLPKNQQIFTRMLAK